MTMPNWVWPTARQAANTPLIRLARVAHWFATAFVALAAVALLLNLMLGRTELIQGIIVPTVIIYALGRGIRYILANE